MTGTYSGFDAFWAERVKKEVKTQMRHLEEYKVVTSKTLSNFYKQLNRPALSKDFRKTSTAKMPQFSDRRSSTPNLVGGSS